MNDTFDFKQALKEIQSGKPFTGKDGVLMPLIKQLVESALTAELDTHLKETPEANRKNGTTSKTIKTPSGNFELATPRDRNCTFEPQLVKKHQTSLSDEIERKILGLFALGNGYRAISEHIADLYGIEVSAAAISAVTDKIIPELREWQQRPLEKLYPVVWLDAIHYKIREDSRYVGKTIYTVLGLDLSGHKEVLGLYLSENEGANFWLGVLTDLHNRGVSDILIACVDGLKGFPEAIAAIFPQTETQLCIVHQIRASLRYVATKDKKAFAADLKPIYCAESREGAEIALDALEATWGAKYAVVIKSWRDKWVNLSLFFRYSKEIRRVIYTTNPIEAVHRQFRKLTKTKGAFPNENSLLKLLYLGILNAQKKWTMPIQNWGLAVSQLAIYFPNRLDNMLGL